MNNEKKIKSLAKRIYKIGVRAALKVEHQDFSPTKWEHLSIARRAGWLAIARWHRRKVK